MTTPTLSYIPMRKKVIYYYEMNLEIEDVKGRVDQKDNESDDDYDDRIRFLWDKILKNCATADGCVELEDGEEENDDWDDDDDITDFLTDKMEDYEDEWEEHKKEEMTRLKEEAENSKMTQRDLAVCLNETKWDLDNITKERDTLKAELEKMKAEMAETKQMLNGIIRKVMIE